VKRCCISFIVIGGIAFVASFGQTTSFTLSSQAQSLRIRKLYFRSLFRQEMSWYDKKESGELVTHIAR